MKKLTIVAAAMMLALGASALESWMIRVPDTLGAVEGTEGFEIPTSDPKGITIPLKDGSKLFVVNDRPYKIGEGKYSTPIDSPYKVADGAVVSRLAEAAAKLPTVKFAMGGVTCFAIYDEKFAIYIGKIVSRGGSFDVYVGLPKGRVLDDEIRSVLAQVELVPPSDYGVETALKMYGKGSKLKAASRFTALKKMVEERAECVELIEALADVARETGHDDTVAWCEAALKKLNPAVYAPDGVNCVKPRDMDDETLAKLSDAFFSADTDFEKATASIPPVTKEAKKAEIKTKTVMLPGDVPMEFIWCEKGTFTMGQNDNEFRPTASQEPRHKVTLTKGFWLAKYELTQRQWKSVATKVQAKFIGDDLPLDSISWKQCHIFAKLIEEKSGIKLRLPTEAEWEYACRAGTRTTFYWGNVASTKHANFNGRGGLSYDEGEVDLEKTTNVGSYEPNPWGFYDMVGNVAEWCEDDWLANLENVNAKDPLYKSDGSTKNVVRGGNWQVPGPFCRSASRDYNTNSRRSEWCGVRFVLDE